MFAEVSDPIFDCLLFDFLPSLPASAATAPPADGPTDKSFLPVPLSPFAALQALTFEARLAKVRAGSAELFWHGCCGSAQPGYIRLGKDVAAGGLVGAGLAGETIGFSTVRNMLWLIMIHPE